MSAVAAPPPAACPAPVTAPAPDRFNQVVDVVNPGGDPSVLRRAAEAWRQTAVLLRGTAGALDSAVRPTAARWHGQAGSAFAHHWRQLHHSIEEGAATFDQVAASLDEIAAQIEAANEQVHQLYAAIGVTVALGVAMSLVTVGVGSAGAAAAVTAQAGRAATIVARLGNLLTISARTMSGFRAAFLAFSQRWALAAAGNVVATGAQKAVFEPSHNPLAGWTIQDVTRIVVGATAQAGTASLAGGSTRFSSAAARHPLATASATGFAGGGAGSLASDLWVDRRPLSLTAVRNALVNGASGGGAGLATQGLLGRLAVGRAAVGPAPATGAGAGPAGLARPGGGAPLVAVRRPPLWVPSSTWTEAAWGVPVDAAAQVGVAVAQGRSPRPASPAPSSLPCRSSSSTPPGSPTSI